MMGASNRSPCAAFIGALLATALSTGAARAEAGVSIYYESDDQLELAQRVASELTTEGYAVEVRRDAEPSPCDANWPRLVTVPRGTKTWIRLISDPLDPDTITASICYLGAQPFLQQAAPRAARANVNELALATAEALNGLRSRLPPLESDPERLPPRKENPPPSREPPPLPVVPPEPLVNSAVLGTGLVWNLPDFPATGGVMARATLGLTRSVGIAIDTFVPFGGRELESEAVTVKIQTTWLRVGPAFRGALGDFELSGAVLVGPAFTWATAIASSPRVGTTDVTPGAVITLGMFLEYPRQTAIFACASASASALVPGVEVALGGGGQSPRGSWPLDTSIGFGARWGSEP